MHLQDFKHLPLLTKDSEEIPGVNRVDITQQYLVMIKSPVTWRDLIQILRIKLVKLTRRISTVSSKQKEF